MILEPSNKGLRGEWESWLTILCHKVNDRKLILLQYVCEGSMYLEKMSVQYSNQKI